MPRRHNSPIPSDLRPRLEAARLDTLALLRAIDQAIFPPGDLPKIELHELYELDADCAEALWALDQPPGGLDLEAMVADTLASLDLLPDARNALRSLLPSPDKVQRLEAAIRAGLDPAEAYNDIPDSDPHER